MGFDIIILFFDSIPLWAMLVPIFICSLVALAVIIERLFFFKRLPNNFRTLFREVVRKIRSGKILDANKIMASAEGPISDVVSSYLMHFDDQDKIIILEENAEIAVRKVEKYIGVISTIATVSPMLGLLGTVTGMMKSFTGLESYDILASGIAEALITTAFGLVVAIPSLIFYNYMVQKAEFYIKEMEFVANTLLDLGSNEKI
jgi:biopolymer transport protein ExbB